MRGGGVQAADLTIDQSRFVPSRPFPSRQLEEVKASERNLRSRLKALNGELAVYKRG